MTNIKARILNLCGAASLLGFAVILGGRFFYVLLFAALLIWNLAGKRWGWAVADLALAAVCFVCLLLYNVRDYWPDSSLENGTEYPQLADQWVYLSIY